MKMQNILARRFKLVSLLTREPVLGMSNEKLAELLEVSRPTVDRDLKALRTYAGIRLSKRLVSGNIHHVINGFSLSLAITPLQLTALRVAHGLLGSRGKSELARELDLLLGPSSPARTSSTSAKNHSSGASDRVLEQLDIALERRMRVRIEVHVAKYDGKLCSYVLDPMAIRLAQDDSYLDAWSIEGKGLRTFKLIRISRVELLDERADEHPEIKLNELFQNSVKTWSGDPTLVRIRIIPKFAWLAREYELVRDQRLIQQSDGGVIVEATVAGIVEASRWTLSWGYHAEALEPPALRALAQAELRQALAHYGDPDDLPGPSSAEQVRSRSVSEVEEPPPAPVSGKRLRSKSPKRPSRKRA